MPRKRDMLMIFKAFIFLLNKIHVRMQHFELMLQQWTFNGGIVGVLGNPLFTWPDYYSSNYNEIINKVL